MTLHAISYCCFKKNALWGCQAQEEGWVGLQLKHFVSDMQVIDELDRCPYSTLLKYVATDVSASWGASLTKAIKAPSLDFQVRHCSRTLLLLLWSSLLELVLRFTLNLKRCEGLLGRENRLAGAIYSEEGMCMPQVWDVNKPAPASLGGPFDLILASNAIHTCDNIAGPHRPACHPPRLSPLNSGHHMLVQGHLTHGAGSCSWAGQHRGAAVRGRVPAVLRVHAPGCLLHLGPGCAHLEFHRRARVRPVDAPRALARAARRRRAGQGL